MEKQIKLWILHAGLGHKSPYFYSLCNEFSKHKNIEVIVKPDLPIDVITNNGIIYFNRLKRFYDSNDYNSVVRFLEKIDVLKNNGWKLIFTLHNFFPIDRKITEIDEMLLEQFLPKMDLVFTFSNFMKEKLYKHFGIEAINHSIGNNILSSDFDKKILLPKLKQESYVFTFIGNISEYKMLDVVIESFKKIKSDDVYLVIAGPSNKNYNLQYNLSKNIIRINEFIGEKNWKKICKMTDVFLNSYDVNRACFKYGFFPSNCIKIVESKKFCIVPKCDVMNEFLPKGYFYSYENADDLYKKMKKAIKNRNLIKNKEKNYPVYDYSWESMVEIIISSIKKII